MYAQGLATEFQNLANLPTVQGPVAIAQIIIAHMNAQFNQMNTRFDQIQQRLNASDRNAVARVQNSLLNDGDEELTPLVNLTTNEEIPNFPTTPSEIDGLNTHQALNPLLSALNQSTEGTAAARRQRLRITIGLTATRRRGA